MYVLLYFENNGRQ